MSPVWGHVNVGVRICVSTRALVLWRRHLGVGLLGRVAAAGLTTWFLVWPRCLTVPPGANAASFGHVLPALVTVCPVDLGSLAL